MLSVVALTAVAQQKKVAVYVTGEDVGVNKVLGSKLVAAIARSNEYSAIERTDAFLSQLAKEQSYQRTGAVDDSEISRLGKQFGVQYVCVATVSKAFNEDYISARLIDVETAQVERTASSAGAIQSLDDLINAANTLSKDLLTRLKERQQNVKKVAIYVVKSDAVKNIGRVLGDKLVAGFTNSGKYIAIERTNSFLSQLTKEQNYQRTGTVDDNDISRLGKQFGVQYVCIADVSEVFGEKYISARLIDVETAEVVNSYDAGGNLNNMSSCLTMANTIATNLSKGTFKEQEEELKAKMTADSIRRAEEVQRKKELEAQRIALHHQQEKERRENKIKETLAKGYIVIGSIYVTYPTLSGEVSWKEANRIRENCRIGGYSTWRFPTASEMRYICSALKDNSDYEIERNFLQKYSVSYYCDFTTLMPWGENHSCLSCNGLWKANYDGVTEVILVR